MRRLLIVVLLASLLCGGTAIGADPVGEVMQSLSCRCGCGMVLDTCRSTMKECAIASRMEATTNRLLQQGRSPQEITRYFLSQYGEIVLAAPTKKGFNVVAWTAPFIAIISGGVVIYLAIKYWIRKPEAVATLDGIPTPLKDRYERRLEEELKEFE